MGLFYDTACHDATEEFCGNETYDILQASFCVVCMNVRTRLSMTTVRRSIRSMPYSKSRCYMAVPNFPYIYDERSLDLLVLELAPNGESVWYL
jgi:hypothetical protein